MFGERGGALGVLVVGLLLGFVRGGAWAAEATSAEAGHAASATPAAVGEQVDALLVRAGAKRQSHLYEEALGVLDAASQLIGTGAADEQLTRLRERVAKTAESVRLERDEYQSRGGGDRRQEDLQAAAQRKADAQAKLQAMERQVLKQAAELYGHQYFVEAAGLAQAVLDVEPENAEARALVGRAQEQAGRQGARGTTVAAGQGQGQLPGPVKREAAEPRPSAPASVARVAGEAWRARLQDQLRRPVSLDFSAAPLSQVVEFLGTITGTNILLDRQGIQAAGKNPDMPISLKVKDVSFADALDWVMDMSGLAYTLRSGVIVVSDPSHLLKRKYMMVYDVRDLLFPVPDYSGPTFNLTQTGGAGGAGGGGSGGGGSLGGTLTTQQGQTGGQGQPAAPSTQVSGQDLVDLITQIIGPQAGSY
jgi:hypothetical protein